jgi:hypothetical protein
MRARAIDSPQRLHDKIRPRSRLSEAQVVDIFLSKATKLSATKICVGFGVSEKAVRDIWTGRTWAKETMHLESMPASFETRTIGRLIDGADQRTRNRMVGIELQSASKSSEIKIGSTSDRPASVGTAEDVCQDNTLLFMSFSSPGYDDVSCKVRSIDDQLYDWQGTFMCSATFLKGFVCDNEETDG